MEPVLLTTFGLGGYGQSREERSHLSLDLISFPQCTKLSNNKTRAVTKMTNHKPSIYAQNEIDIVLLKLV